MVAGMSGLQDAAIAACLTGKRGIGGLSTVYSRCKSTMDQAPGMVTGAAGDAGTMFRTGASGVTGEQMAQYMNPYQQAVFDEINRSFDTQRASRTTSCASRCVWWQSSRHTGTEIGRNRAQALHKHKHKTFCRHNKRQSVKEHDSYRRLRVLER